jgi:transposase-like protein
MSSKQELLNQFKSIDGRRQEEILGLLQIEFEGKSRLIDNERELLRQAKSSKPSCFHCGHERVFRRGLRKGVQQFSCASCKSWFSETSGTVLSGIHQPEKWQEYLRLMQEGGTINGIAKQMGISTETSFRWRHRILAALAKKEVSRLGDVVECDEMEFIMNNRGEYLESPARRRLSDANKASHKVTTHKVKVVVAVDRQGGKFARVAEAERINAKHVQQAIGKKLKKGSSLITDRHSAFVKYAKGFKTIEHKTITATQQKKSKNKEVNKQRVNQTHKQIRDFMRRFNGGVGTKYLQNYLNWYLFQNELKHYSGKIKQVFTSFAGLEFYQAIKLNVANIET